MKKIRLAVISVILSINSNSIKEEIWTNNGKIKEKIPEWESYSKDNYSYRYPAGLAPAEISTPPWNNEIFFSFRKRC